MISLKRWQHDRTIRRRITGGHGCHGVGVGEDDTREKEGEEMIALHGVTLDDYEINSDRELNYGWTQICEGCRSKFLQHGVAHDEGHGICGVYGCDNISDHYLDFDKWEITND